MAHSLLPWLIPTHFTLNGTTGNGIYELGTGTFPGNTAANGVFTITVIGFNPLYTEWYYGERCLYKGHRYHRWQFLGAGFHHQSAPRLFNNGQHHQHLCRQAEQLGMSSGTLDSRFPANAGYHGAVGGVSEFWAVVL